jgi:hypothetical protein
MTLHAQTKKHKFYKNKEKGKKKIKKKKNNDKNTHGGEGYMTLHVGTPH